MRAGLRVVALAGAVGLLGGLTGAQATPDARQSARDAAYLQEAFGHDLCTRDDRELHKLTKALGRKPMSPIGAAQHGK